MLLTFYKLILLNYILFVAGMYITLKTNDAHKEESFLLNLAVNFVFLKLLRFF